MINIQINNDNSGIRLDKYVKKLYPLLTQGILERMIRKSRIKLNGKRKAASTAGIFSGANHGKAFAVNAGLTAQKITKNGILIS